MPRSQMGLYDIPDMMSKPGEYLSQAGSSYGAMMKDIPAPRKSIGGALGPAMGFGLAGQRIQNMLPEAATRTPLPVAGESAGNMMGPAAGEQASGLGMSNSIAPTATKEAVGISSSLFTMPTTALTPSLAPLSAVEGGGAAIGGTLAGAEGAGAAAAALPGAEAIATSAPLVTTAGLAAGETAAAAPELAAAAAVTGPWGLAIGAGVGLLAYLLS